MFTGIIEEVGHVRHVLSGGESGELSVSAHKVLEGSRIGDSIAVNGVCLTVTSITSDGFTADVMAETLRRTNLGSLKKSDPVDLERAMTCEGRLGGHIVSGHIDGTGRIISLKREGNAVWVRVGAAPSILDLIVERGSIAIDGISLTVASVSSSDFQVSIIPHTASETILLKKKAGDIVNLETDIIGKYVLKLLSRGYGSGGPAGEAAAAPESHITLGFLSEHGYGV